MSPCFASSFTASAAGWFGGTSANGPCSAAEARRAGTSASVRPTSDSKTVRFIAVPPSDHPRSAFSYLSAYLVPVRHGGPDANRQSPVPFKAMAAARQRGNRLRPRLSAPPAACRLARGFPASEEPEPVRPYPECL